MSDVYTYLKEWFDRHGWVSLILLATFLIGLFIRIYFAYPYILQFGPINLYSGGSDSYYHWRVTEHVLLYHHDLVMDKMLNYPIGLINPRAPIFDWMNAIFGIILSPLFGGNSLKAAAFSLSIMPTIWGSLIVFPIYLVGKEIGGKKVGILSALMITFMAADVTRSMATFANYLAFYLFVLISAMYFYILLLRSLPHKRYIDNFSNISSGVKGTKLFFSENKRSLQYTLLTGVSIGIAAMSWQGYTYLLALVYIFLIIQLLINMFRKVDSFDLYLTTTIAFGLGFIISFPYYYGVHLIPYWFDMPFYLYIGATVIFGFFVFMRDKPWLLTLSLTAVFVAIASASLYFINKIYFMAIITGQGYFVKTLVYSTVAEAQAPDFSTYLLSFGVASFFMAFVGILLLGWRYSKKFRYEHLFVVVLGFMGAYVAISAGKFIYLGAPSFAIFSGYTLFYILNAVNFEEMRRTFMGFKSSGFYAFKKSIKISHVVIVLFLVFVLVVPNVWYAIDSAIPYQADAKYNAQIYNAIPSVLHPPGYTLANGSSWYVGAFPYSIDTPTQYYPAAYNWLAQQNNRLPQDQRPAFLSWWDYGFQAIAEGHHPAVADNFQDGYQIAGSVLLSQNESSAIALLVARLLQGAYANNGNKLPQPVIDTLQQYDLNVTKIDSFLSDPSAYTQHVLNHPEIYGYYESYLHPMMTEYLMLEFYLLYHLNLNDIVWLYHYIRMDTGYNIEYFAVDSRMFPFSATNTGIFYAPVKLTDQIMGGQGNSVPVNYYNIYAVSTLGATFPTNAVPSGVQIASYKIVYTPMFYNSFLYRAFVGYDGQNLGLSQGMPTLSSTLSSYPPEPAWNMSHFVMVYRTAYWNPYSDYQNHSSAWTAVNYNQAIYYQQHHIGISDVSGQSYLSNGVVILRYYDGAYINGTVKLPDGTAVKGVKVTVLDQYGIPHYSNITNNHGYYSLIAPPGNDTVIVSMGGGFNPLTQTYSTSLNKTYVNVSSAQSMRVGEYNITNNLIIKQSSMSGTVYWNNAGKPTFLNAVDKVLPGTFIELANESANLYYYTNSTSDGSYYINDLLPETYTIFVKVNNVMTDLGNVTVPVNETYTYNIAIQPSILTGKVVYNGMLVPSADVILRSSTGILFKTITNVTGSYRITDLLNGAYNLTAAYGSFSSISSTLYAGYGANVTSNITLYNSTNVTFKIFYKGVPISNGFLRIDNISNGAEWLLTSKAGAARQLLPVGMYTYYFYYPYNGNVYSAIGSFYATNATQIININKAVLLSGFVYEGNTSNLQPSIPVYISNGNYPVITSTNNTGYYSIWLPVGRYEAYVSVGSSLQSATASASVTLTGNQKLNLNLTTGISLPAIVEWPTINNNYTGLAGAFINITYINNNTTKKVSYITNSSGEAAVALPTSDYFLFNISRTGFNTMTINDTFTNLSTQKSLSFKLTPLPVHTIVNIKNVSKASKQMSLSLNVTTINGYPTNTTINLGNSTSKSIVMYPGEYSVYVYSKVNGSLYYVSNKTIINIKYGVSSTILNLTIYLKILTKLYASTPDGTLVGGYLVLRGPEIKTIKYIKGGISSYLLPGNYSLYIGGNSSNDVNWSIIASIVINTKKYDYNFILNESVVVKGMIHNYNGNNILPITIRSENPSSIIETYAINRGYSVILPVNNSYTIIISNRTTVRIGNISEMVTYSYTSTISTYTNSTVLFNNISLNSVVYNQNVTLKIGIHNINATSGHGTMYLSGASGTATYNFTGTSDTISELPGIYALYVVYHSGAYYLANITNISVSKGVSVININMNIAWPAEIEISAPVIGTDRAVNTTLNYDGNSVPMNFAIGSNTLYLMNGYFNLSGNYNYTVYGRMTSYNGNSTIYVNDHSTAGSLYLSKIAVYGLTMKGYTNTEVTAKPGGSFNYSFLLTNTGNEYSSFTFSGQPAGWSFDFTPSVANINWLPGENSTMISVHVKVPSNAQVNSPSVVITATSVNNAVSASLTLNVSVAQVFGISMYMGRAISFNNNYISIPFTIANSGNGVDNYTLSLINSAAIRQDGWIGVFTNGVTNISYTGDVSQGANNTYVLRLFPVSHVPSTNFAVYIEATSLKSYQSDNIHLNITTSQLSLNKSSTVTGPIVGPVPPPFDYTPYIWGIVALSVAVIAVVAYNKWRMIKRRKFY